MKISLNVFVKLAAMVVVVALTGCATFSSSKTQPLEGPYSLKVHKASDSRGEEGDPQVELIYQGADKEKHVVWPRVVNVLVHGDTALFIGELGKEMYEGGGRLFAYNPPGPVVNVTKQVVEFAVREKVKGISANTKSPKLGALKKTDEGFEIEIGMSGWGTPYIDVTWAQLAEMIRAGTLGTAK